MAKKNTLQVARASVADPWLPHHTTLLDDYQSCDNTLLTRFAVVLVGYDKREDNREQAEVSILILGLSRQCWYSDEAATQLKLRQWSRLNAS